MFENKTLNDILLNVLESKGSAMTALEVEKYINEHNLYDFRNAKTPIATISSTLGSFIRNNDSRVNRIKMKGGFVYYHSKHGLELESDVESFEDEKKVVNKTYNERDLHPLLSSFEKSRSDIFMKTIFHEKSSNSKDRSQKWIHPDMVGLGISNLKNENTKNLLRITNQIDSHKIISYELKKSINTDSELKQSFFQAVSNSSWANYGYLVAFEISSGLMPEIERLNQSFGIGVIELKSNPFESKVLFQSKYKKADFATIDKLCKINKGFDDFIKKSVVVLTAESAYINSSLKEFTEYCDDYLVTDSEIMNYCEKYKIPYENGLM